MSLCSNIYYDLSACRLQHSLSSLMDNIALQQNLQSTGEIIYPMLCTQVSSILASSKRHQLAYFTTHLGYQFPIVWPPVRKKGGQWSFPHRSASNLHGQWRVTAELQIIRLGQQRYRKKARYFLMHIFISSVGDTSFQSVNTNCRIQGNAPANARLNEVYRHACL